MRKKIVFLFILFSLFILNSCKRDTAEDPGWIPNSGISYYLFGISDPTNLYIPYPSVRSSSWVYVTLYNAIGQPQSGRGILFQQFEKTESGAIIPYGLGYFWPGNLSGYATTGPDGSVVVEYIIPGFDLTQPLHGDALYVTKVLIKATLVSELPEVSTYTEIDVSVAPKPPTPTP